MTDLWNIYFDVKSISNRTNSFKNPEFGDTFLTDLICLRAWASLMSLCCICNKHVSVTHHLWSWSVHQEGRGDGGGPADPRPAVDKDPGVGALKHRGVDPLSSLLQRVK